MFPSDDDVLEAAISLVTSVLTAVEKMIGFFVKSRGKSFYRYPDLEASSYHLLTVWHLARKAISAIFKGEDYESGVIGSLEDITNASNELHREATKAGWTESARNWKKAEERKHRPFAIHLNSYFLVQSDIFYPGHAEIVEAFRLAREDVQGAREDVRGAREDVRGARDNIIDHQDSVKNELKNEMLSLISGLEHNVNLRVEQAMG